LCQIWKGSGKEAGEEEKKEKKRRLVAQFHHDWNVLWSKSSVSAWLEYVMVQIVSFCMAGLRHGQNCPFQHVWIMSRSKLSVSACLDYAMVKIVRFNISGLCHGQIVSFSMSGLCHCQNCQFQHVCIMPWSKSPVSAWLECDMVKITGFSMSGSCGLRHGQNCPLQHVWIMS
jgi:hypothetical protein